MRKKALEPPAPVVPQRTVAELLATARAAHSRYRAHAGRIDKHGTVSSNPDLWICGQAVQEALRARIDAEELDPKKLDAAWREDDLLMRDREGSLISFYCRYLSPPEAYITA